MATQHESWAVSREGVPMLARADVAVVGGGFPGVCAAVGATRAGAAVALIERDGALGGQAAEIYTFGLDGFFDRNGKQYVKGVPWEIMQKTLVEGQSDPTWDQVDYARLEQEGIEAEVRRLGMDVHPFFSQTYVNPNAFRYVLQSLVDEEEITTFLESPLSGVVLDRDRVAGIVAQGCYRPFAVECKIVVDTTPHAAVAALAGRRSPHSVAYVGTHPRVAGMDVHRLLAYVKDGPDEVSLRGIPSNDTALAKELVDKGTALLMDGFRKARARAVAQDPAYEITGRGDPPFFTFFYDRDGCGTHWVHSKEWADTRLDDPAHLSRTIAEMRKRQWLTHKLFRDYVPGFEKAQLIDIHPHIARALHVSREPGGFTEYDIPWEHVEKNGQIYEDSIVRVMGHPDAGQAPGGFQVPYRSLIPKGLEGLLVIGKPACPFFHYHGTNAALGQAAGVAAAVAAKEGGPLRELPVSKVQKELERQGAVVF